MAIIFVINFIPSQASAVITNGEDAIGVLGQYNEGSGTSLTSNYTKFGIGNGPSPLGFSGPGGITIDHAAHMMYVVDPSTNRVLVYQLDVSNVLVDPVPDYVLGQQNFNSNDFGLTMSGLQNPNAVAIDEVNHRLFVADSANNRVLVYDVTTITNGENAVNVLGQSSFTVSTGTTTQTGMKFPFGLVYSSASSTLYVLEQGNNRIITFDVASITDGESAIHVLGQSTFTTGSVGVNQSGLNISHDMVLATSTNLLYVADMGSRRVMIFDVATITDGENAVNILGQSTYFGSTATTSQSGFQSVSGIAYDPASKRLFVSDSTSNRVSVFDMNSITNNENAVNVLGQQNFTTTLPGTSAQTLRAPSRSFFDPDNNILYVFDGGNFRILGYNVGTVTDGQSATSVIGQYNDETLGALTSNFAKGKAYNAPNRLGMESPASVLVSATDHLLFVADSNLRRITIYNLDSSNNLIDFVPDYVLGQNDFVSSDVDTSINRFSPSSLAYDSLHKRLFVGELTNNRVIVFDLHTISNGQSAVNVLGQSNFSASSTALTQSGMSGPNDVAYDEVHDRLFVADGSNRRVLVFDVATITDGENAVNVLGQTGFGVNISTTTQSGLGNVTGLAFDSVHNRLFAADTTGVRIVVYDTSSIVDGQNAVNVLGQTNFTNKTTGSTQSTFLTMQKPEYDSINDRLFVSDYNRSRIMIFDVASITNGQNAVNVIGAPDFTSSTTTPAKLVGRVTDIAFDPSNEKIYASSQTRIGVRIFDVSLPDTVPPQISTTTINSESSSATISIISNEISTSTIEYGSSASYGLNMSSGVSSTTQNIVISGLTGCTSYHFRIKLWDSSGNLTVSSDQIFTTYCQPVAVQTSGGSSGGSYAITVLNNQPVPTEKAQVVTTAQTKDAQTQPAPQVPSASIIPPADLVLIETTKDTRESLPLINPIRQLLPAQIATVIAINVPVQKNLSTGAENSEVVRLQRFLNILNYAVSPNGAGSPGKETSYFGSKTKVALAKFQAANGIPATGYFGPITRAYIRNYGLAR